MARTHERSVSSAETLEVPGVTWTQGGLQSG